MGQQEYDNFKRLIREWLDSHPHEYATIQMACFLHGQVHHQEEHQQRHENQRGLGGFQEAAESH